MEEEANFPILSYPCIHDPDPLLGFITLDSTKDAFRKYIWNSAGNSYEYSGSSMSTFSTRRGEMNNRRIYVLPDRYSSNIGFYDLSSFGTSPVIRSQSGNGGHWGACGFMDEDIVVCTTRTTGDIYKYNITNNYEQVRIPTNNPSGDGFVSLLVTKDKKYILAAYSGCIYIYNSSGAYIGYSDNSQTVYFMLQMKEIRENIILTAQGHIYSYDISNTGDIIKHKLLDYENTKTIYFTIEVLEGNKGDIAIGGYYKPSETQYGYVELFHLNEDNSTLLPISNKRWVGEDNKCDFLIIREIQTGVIIFGGREYCKDICSWEYAVIPHKEPICFPLGGHRIWDIISLP